MVKGKKMKSKYEVRDEIACMLIDNCISLDNIVQIFKELEQMKKDGLFEDEI